MCGFSHGLPAKIAVGIFSTDFNTQFYFLIAFENDLNLKTFAIFVILCVGARWSNRKVNFQLIAMELFVAYSLKFGLNDSHWKMHVLFDEIFSFFFFFLFSRLYFFALDDVISILSYKSQKLKKDVTFKEKLHRRRRVANSMQRNVGQNKQWIWLCVTLTIFPSIKVYHRHFSLSTSSSTVNTRVLYRQSKNERKYRIGNGKKKFLYIFTSIRFFLLISFSNSFITHFDFPFFFFTVPSLCISMQQKKLYFSRLFYFSNT